MIPSLACLLMFGDKPKVGQQWHYTLTWHFYDKELNLTDEESFDVEVTRALPASTTLKVSQKLLATLMDDLCVPTDPKAAPTAKEWALSSSGSIAFMPDARFPLETRVFRILKGILPEPKGDLPRTQKWTIEYEDDGLGIPQSRLNGQFVEKTVEGNQFLLNYREKGGTNGAGRFTRSEKSFFPTFLEIKFTNTKMSGGTDIVNCDLTLKLKDTKQVRLTSGCEVQDGHQIARYQRLVRAIPLPNR
jgi:hypothetical protein